MIFAGLLISMFALTVKVLQPISIQLVVDGQLIEFTQQPPFYSSGDVVMIGVSAFIAGSCLMYLLSEKVSPGRVEVVKAYDPHKVVSLVEDEDERKLLELIVGSGGSMYQSDLVEESGFSKGKVSILLDRLEARSLVKRERSGMTNRISIVTQS